MSNPRNPQAIRMVPLMLTLEKYAVVLYYNTQASVPTINLPLTYLACPPIALLPTGSSHQHVGEAHTLGHHPTAAQWLEAKQLADKQEK